MAHYKTDIDQLDIFCTIYVDAIRNYALNIVPYSEPNMGIKITTQYISHILLPRFSRAFIYLVDMDEGEFARYCHRKIGEANRKHCSNILSTHLSTSVLCCVAML